MPSTLSSFRLLGKPLEWAASGSRGRQRQPTRAAPDATKNRSLSSAPRRSQRWKVWTLCLGHFFSFRGVQSKDEPLIHQRPQAGPWELAPLPVFRARGANIGSLSWCQVTAPRGHSTGPLSPTWMWTRVEHLGPRPLKGLVSQHHSLRGPDLTTLQGQAGLSL